MLRNTISIAANLGGRKSVWCCLFPNCRKAFTGDSINCLCGDLVHFGNRNVLSLWKMSQSYKGPQQIRSDFVPTLSLFCLLADKFFFQRSRSHSFPYPFAFPTFSFGFLWNTFWKLSEFFSQVQTSVKEKLRNQNNKIPEGVLLVTMS